MVNSPLIAEKLSADEQTVLRIVARRYDGALNQFKLSPVAEEAEIEYGPTYEILLTLQRQGLVKVASVDQETWTVYRKASDVVDALDYEPPRDYQAEALRWWKSRWWSVPVSVAIFAAGALATILVVVGWILRSIYGWSP